METKTYSQYVTEVKDWAEQAMEIVKTSGLKGQEISQFQDELDNLISELEEKLHEDSRYKIFYNDVKEIEEKARGLFQQSTNLQQNHVSGNDLEIEKKVPIGNHQLPPLPYSYDALEPKISAEIMRLHHDEHHKSYVEGLNKAEKEMEKARKKGNFDLLKHWEREAAFHGSGHYLHTIFWHNMSPNGGGKPTGPLMDKIVEDFGSYESFTLHFTEAANKVEGVGWAILVWVPRSHRLEILQTEKHQLFTQWDTIPLLVLDVWEHAYYLQYKNKKSDYIKNWWNVVNWSDVTKRFKAASKLKWSGF